MLLTREADYAVVCVLEVARNDRVSTAEIARRHGISASFVANIVHSLARVGIAVTARGARGGVSLARPADSVTLLEVVEAIQGRLTVNACLAQPLQCDRAETCSAFAIFRDAQSELRRRLDVTFAELLERERRHATRESLVDAGPVHPPEGDGDGRRGRALGARSGVGDEP